MEDRKTLDAGRTSVVTTRIAQLRNRLLNRVMLFGFVGVCLATVVSIARAPVTGLRPIFILDLAFVVAITVLVVLKERIPYHARLFAAISGTILGACTGIYSVGLMGYGSLVLLLAVILAAAFGNRVVSFIVTGIAGAAVLVFALLFGTGAVGLPFELGAYHGSYVSWLNLFAGIMAIGIATVIIVTSLLGSLSEFARQSEDNLAEIGRLNQTLEQKVTSRTSELEQSNREKDRILGVLAHDINNKLVGIVGYLDLLTENAGAVPQSDRLEYARQALRGSTRARDIVNDLLEFARTSRHEQHLTTEPVDMCDFVRSTIDGTMPAALDKGIALKTERVPEHAYCTIDKGRMSRVIDNLIVNAVKYTPRGGTVTVDIGVCENHVLITVKDTGIGIPRALHEHLFEPFTPSRRPGTDREKSTGLGLSISREIVEQHGGRIWFESEEGQGSSFFLQLPSSEPA